MALSGCVACGSPASETPPAKPDAAAVAAASPTERPYLLERVDEAAVVQLYADGFRELPLKEKTLIWHLYQAALAGRDIYYDQRYAHALEMRDVLEAILTAATPAAGSAGAAVDPATLTEIQRYTKLFWLNTGPYNNLTARKFVLNLTPEAFAAAAQAAAAAGAIFPLRKGEKSETLDQLLARLQPMFFDASVDPMVTAKTPPPGKDHPDREREQPVCRRHHEGPERLRREVSAQLAAREDPDQRQAGRRGLPDQRTIRRSDRGHRPAPRGGHPLRHRADGAGPARAHQVLPDRRNRRPRGVRHRVGERQGLAGRHHQRLHRGLSRRARHQGGVGRSRLLREPREDRRDQAPGERCAVVRGPHALGSEIPQAGGAGHHRQRHRRRHRNRRFRTDYADRHQPAERPGGS